jgi:hypothetical protein
VKICAYRQFDQARPNNRGRMCTGPGVAMPHAEFCTDCHELVVDLSRTFLAVGEGRLNEVRGIRGAQE